MTLPATCAEAPDREALERQAARLGSDYLLRSLAVLRSAAGGDLMASIVLIAVVQANVAHLDEATTAWTPAGASAPPDTLRRPISVLALAHSLSMPYETVRRTVARLIREGLLIRTGDGILAPGGALDDAGFHAGRQANWTNLRRLLAQLDRAGLADALRSGPR